MKKSNETAVIKKAVIAAAGMGTRFLPQTKAMPKEMLPIVDKPVIQYVVEGLVAAGVEQIIIVTGSTKRPIEDHFDRNVELEQSLLDKGKTAEAEQIKAIGNMANFIYVRQKGLPSGNARPLLNVAPLLEGEPFYYFFADDFFSGEVPAASQLLQVYRECQTSVVALQKVDKSKVNLYGIADVREEIKKDSVYNIKRIIEKPERDEAPSDLAVGSGYLFTPEVLPILKQLKPSKRGELEVTDAISDLATNQGLMGKVIEGQYHDTGNPLSYLQTQIDVALEHPELGGELGEYLKHKIDKE